MKKILLFATALAGLFLAGSCQRENLEPVGGNIVTFTVEAPGAIATKTIADGLNVNEVHYEVYKNVEGVEHALLNPDSEPMAKGVVEMANKKANITLDLLQDQEYTVIFWAQVKDAGHYDTSDLRCIELAQNHQVYANDETRAAFFKRFDFDTYEHKDYKEIMLRRPFAQLNLLTTMESLKPVSTGQTSGYEIDAKQSEIIVTGLAASFNTVTGVGNGVNYPFTFNMAATPEEQGQATLTVNGKAYHYVSMNYMFVPVDPEEGSTVNLEYEIVTDKGSIEHEIVNVPIKENYRTNVIGNLFTKESKFEIIVDAEFDGEYFGPQFVEEPAKNDLGQYVIENEYELAWLAAMVNNTLPKDESLTKAATAPSTFKGETFVLGCDIDLKEFKNWTPIGATGKFEGTFDGQNHTISNLVVKTEGKTPAGLFGMVQSGTVKNVKVVNADVHGNYSAAVVVAHGVCAKIESCHVEDAVVVSTPVNGDEGNNVGAIAGFLGADGGSAYVKNSTVKNANITGYRKVGGVVGAANQAAVVTGNRIESSVITADQTAKYNEVKPAHAGAVTGYAHADAVVDGNDVAGGINTANANAVKVFVLIDDAEDIKANKDVAVVLPAGTYTFTETVESASLQVNNGNDVTINANDNTLAVGTANAYGFVAEGEGTTLEINDANIDSKGGAIAANGGAKVTVNNSTVAVNSASTSNRYNVYAVGEGTEVTINSGEFSFSKTLNQKRAYIYCGAGATVYVKGGTFGKASARSGYTAGILGDGTVIITGGTFGFDPSAWLAEGCVATKVGTEWTVAPETLVTDSDELKAAVASAQAGDVIYLAAGEYAINYKAGVKLVGASADKVSLGVSKGYGVNGDVAIENVTLKFTNSNYTGFQHTAVEVYKNCVIEGQPFLYGTDVTFEKCTFNQSSSNAYNVWTYGAKNVTFNGCTFNCAGKSVLVYNEKGHVHNVTFNECVLNASAPAEGKAAVEIDSSFPNGGTGHYTVNFISTSANGFANGNKSGNSLWNNKKGDNATVNVDGVTVL